MHILCTTPQYLRRMIGIIWTTTMTLAVFFLCAKTTSSGYTVMHDVMSSNGWSALFFAVTAFLGAAIASGRIALVSLAATITLSVYSFVSFNFLRNGFIAGTGWFACIMTASMAAFTLLTVNELARKNKLIRGE